MGGLIVGLLASGLIWWVWLAVVVAWRRTRWFEYLRWLLSTSMIVLVWLLTFSIPMFGVESANLFSMWVLLAVAVFLIVLMINNGWMHVPGFANVADWLRFRVPDPELRYAKAPPRIIPPPEIDGLLWVPKAPPSKLSLTRRVVRGYLVFLVMMIICMVLTVLHDVVTH